MFTKPIKNNYHRTTLRRATTMCALCTLATFIPGQQVMAQENESLTLEEIVVTSRRYEESLNDAPVAVNVMSEDFLKDNRVSTAEDIMDITPGATWEAFSKVQPTMSMRGIVAPTPGNSSSEASIQVVVDNVVISKDFMKAPPIFDIGRVEILRGPQGTAFGRNASVGLLHFVTNRPSQEFSGSISATIGSDELYEIDGFINGALTDSLSGRLAFNHDQEDGPMESVSTGDGLDAE